MIRLGFWTGFVVLLAAGLGAQVREPEIPGFPGERDPFTWGATFDSPWNLPLSTSAILHPVGKAVGGLVPTPSLVYVDVADVSVLPSFPIKTLRGRGFSAQVHCDPELSADGTWNHCGAFLEADGVTIVEGQTTLVSPGQDPSFGGQASSVYPPYNLKTSPGIVGSHGGSALSCLGGTLRIGELTGDQEIFHCLGGGLDAMRSYHQKTGHVWPAQTQDGYYRSDGDHAYQGPDPLVAIGSLLVLRADFDERQLCSTREGQKVARALKRYGFYCKDDTYTSGNHQIDIDGRDLGALAAVKSWGFQKDWQAIFSHCFVVTNNGPKTPGGGPIGSSRRMPYAPAFTDGTGAPPAGLEVVSLR